jgi:hypothetical protein
MYVYFIYVYIKHMLINLMVDYDIIVGDLYTPLSSMDRSDRKLKKQQSEIAP